VGRPRAGAIAVGGLVDVFRHRASRFESVVRHGASTSGVLVHSACSPSHRCSGLSFSERLRLDGIGIVQRGA
jgi:hypothetical protein